MTKPPVSPVGEVSTKNLSISREKMLDTSPIGEYNEVGLKSKSRTAYHTPGEKESRKGGRSVE
jgi:hypothetical protein